MKKLAFLLVGILALPPVGLLSAAALLSPALISCTTTTSSLVLGDIPESLSAHTADDAEITLTKQQLTRAATIITVGAQTTGVGRDGVMIALMAALTESGLRMLANSAAYPGSIDFPNDGDGSDHDSLGLFQLRPSAGWGSVRQLMDATYQARAFFGGPAGPNAGSPAGLLDIDGWESLEWGAAAQAVEVSAYPDRYDNYQPVAEAILTTLTAGALTAQSPGASTIPQTSRVVFPLPTGTYTTAYGFGWRSDPFTGIRTFHAGTDYAARGDTPILAIADGTVTFAGVSGNYGGLIIIEHSIGTKRVASYYAHMWSTGIHVTKGEHVTAGQHIGNVGSAGRSTGSHLHFEMHPGGPTHPAVDAAAWLKAHGVTSAGSPLTSTAGCISAGLS